jgi:hypothetical protein
MQQQLPGSVGTLPVLSMNSFICISLDTACSRHQCVGVRLQHYKDLDTFIRVKEPQSKATHAEQVPLRLTHRKLRVHLQLPPHLRTPMPQALQAAVVTAGERLLNAENRCLIPADNLRRHVWAIHYKREFVGLEYCIAVPCDTNM